VRDGLAQLIADVQAGKTQPRIATALALLMSLQLRAIGTTDLERRLATPEESSAEAGTLLKRRPSLRGLRV
jgi:hypothetical protein